MFTDIFVAINQAAIDIFSNMGFIDIAPLKKDYKNINSPLTVEVDITMPIKSKIYISLPLAIFHQVGENLFPDFYNKNNQEIVEDSAKEFANTLIGDIFQISTPDVLFELSIPQIVSLEQIDLTTFDKQTFTTIDDQTILIAHQLKELMSENDLQDKPSNNEGYTEININKFFEFTKVNCNVYVRLSPRKYVKVINKNQNYDRTTTDKYLKRGVKNFYIFNEDMPEFSKLFAATVNNIINDENTSEESKKEAIEAAFNFVNKQAAQFGVSNAITQEMNKVIHTSMTLVQRDKKLRSMIKNTMDGKDLCKFSILVSYISAGMASLMEWSTESINEKLGMAAIFHEIHFSNIDLALIDDLNSPKIAKLDEQTKNLIKSHPLKVAEMLRNNKGIPHDVDAIIATHHERPDGSGFPRGLTANNISPLSALFIIARDFASKVYGRDISDKDIAHIMQNFQTVYNKGSFRAPLHALETMLQNELLK